VKKTNSDIKKILCKPQDKLGYVPGDTSRIPCFPGEDREIILNKKKDRTDKSGKKGK